MKYSGKTFIVGMVTVGIMAAGLALPSSASALSLQGVGDGGGLTPSNAISLGTLAGGSLQGGAWTTQDLRSSTTDATANSTATKSSAQAEGKGSGELHLSSAGMNNPDTAASAAVNGGAQASSNSDTGSSATGLQGGLGLTLNLSANSSTESTGGNLLGL